MRVFKKTLCILILVLMACLSLFACTNEGENTGETRINRYSGKNELHLKYWDNTDYFIFEGMTESENETVIPYNKSMTDKYAYIFTAVEGKLADFSYLNLKLKSGSARGRTATVRIFNALEDSENENIIGGDFDIALDDTYKIYTLKIKSTYRTRLDLAKFVTIYPDIGKGGLGYRDTLYMQDAWFSSAVPNDAVLSNPNVDSGGASGQVVNQWTNPSWTKYTLYKPSGENSEAILSFGSQAQDWAVIERTLDITEQDIRAGTYNELKFNFTNLPYKSGTACSIEHIKFSLKGDFLRTVTPDEGVEYEYDLFYEAGIGSYTLSESDKIDTPIDLSFNITSALMTLLEHCKDGIRLSINVESEITAGNTVNEVRDLNGDGVADYDRLGEMEINSVNAGFNEEYGTVDPTANQWTTDTSWTGYQLGINGSETTVKFTKAAEWASIGLKLNYEDGNDLIKFEFFNKPLTGEFGSVTNIFFKLRGDIKSEETDPDGNKYYLYYEETVSYYVYTAETAIVGNVIMEIPILEAVAKLAGHTSGGIELILNIESDPMAGVGDAKGDMTIIKTELVTSVKNKKNI